MDRQTDSLQMDKQTDSLQMDRQTDSLQMDRQTEMIYDIDKQIVYRWIDRGGASLYWIDRQFILDRQTDSLKWREKETSETKFEVYLYISLSIHFKL